MQIQISTWLWLFVAFALFDTAYIMYIQAVNEVKALKASLIGVVMYLLTAYGTTEYVSNFINVIPILAGSFLGTFVTLKITKRNSEKDS